MKNNLFELKDISLYSFKKKKVYNLDKDLRMLVKVLKDSPPPKYIVDYGCGSGHIGTIAAKMFKRSEIVLLADDTESEKISKINIENNELHNAEVMLEGISKIRFPPDMIIIRVTGFEGKKRIENRIKKSLKALAINGQLIIICHKKRGAASLLRTLTELISPAEVVTKSGGHWIIRLYNNNYATALDKFSPSIDNNIINYQLNGKKYKFETESSIFSKMHIDRISHLLLKNINIGNATRILDLGTGYGVIGIVLADRYPEAQVFLVDVNRQAIEVALRNTKINNVEMNTKVILSDNINEISDVKFDLIVSNFPLHIPYKDKLDIIYKCSDILNTKGRFYVTVVRVKQFDLRPLMIKVFGNVTTLVESGSEIKGGRVSYSEKR